MKVLFDQIPTLSQWRKRTRRTRSSSLATGQQRLYRRELALANTFLWLVSLERSDDDAPKSAKPAAAVPANGASDDEDEPAPTAQRSKFSFASFGDEPADANDDDDDDGGGLMSAVRASEKRKKDKKNKKKAKAADIDEEDDFAAESKQQDDAEPEVDLASKAPVEMTTDQLMEEEFGPVKPKGGKGKKGKKGKAQQPDDFDEDAFLAEEAAKAMALNAAKAQETAPAAQEQPATPAKAEVEDAGDDDEGEGVTKVLSKKEKEKLKKEKEKVGKPGAIHGGAV